MKQTKTPESVKSVIQMMQEITAKKDDAIQELLIAKAQDIADHALKMKEYDEHLKLLGYYAGKKRGRPFGSVNKKKEA